jgi:hypothetical protein
MNAPPPSGFGIAATKKVMPIVVAIGILALLGMIIS